MRFSCRRRRWRGGRSEESGSLGGGGFFGDGGVEVLDEVAIGLGEAFEGEFEGFLLDEEADVALADEGGAGGEDGGGGV